MLALTRWTERLCGRYTTYVERLSSDGGQIDAEVVVGGLDRRSGDSKEMVVERGLRRSNGYSSNGLNEAIITDDLIRCGDRANGLRVRVLNGREGFRLERHGSKRGCEGRHVGIEEIAIYETTETVVKNRRMRMIVWRLANE